MNKFSKSGFSLAEILIALGIISVIATMGFSVAKKVSQMHIPVIFTPDT